MKLHELRPAAGAHTPRTRVGRGIAAGKGKTAGRGTKGQKARAGGSIPTWFEGGQTPLHMRIPKLRGFKRRFKVEYEVVNVGAIAAAAERGAFEGAEHGEQAGSKPKKGAPVTVNQDLLRAVGLVRTLGKPLKILGSGELSTPLFVVADAFTKSAAAKIEAAGGTVSVLETPKESRKALGVGDEAAAEAGPQPDVPTPPAEFTAADDAPKAGRSKPRASKPAAEAPAEASAATPSVEPETTRADEPAAGPAGTADAEAEPTAEASGGAAESDATPEADAPAGDEPA